MALTASEIAKEGRRVVKRYRVTSGKKFRLADVDPADTAGLEDEYKEEAKQVLQRGVERLAELQDMLYAQDRWGVLLIFQAMDAAGKDSAIKHVMSGVNPQGCQVASFKVPSTEELDHDYLWRTTRHLPARGNIGIFNRSYYEEVLVVRVHPEFLARQHLPQHLVDKRIFECRYEDIASYERYLDRNGIVVRKFFLHVSQEEQRRRFLARIELPEKNWKFSVNDVKERAHWDEYMEAYEDMIRATATEHAPWFVIPADNKWFTRLVVAAAIVDTLAGLDLAYPELDPERRTELEEARKALGGGRPGRGTLKGRKKK